MFARNLLRRKSQKKYIFLLYFVLIFKPTYLPIRLCSHHGYPFYRFNGLLSARKYAPLWSLKYRSKCSLHIKMSIILQTHKRFQINIYEKKWTLNRVLLLLIICKFAIIQHCKNNTHNTMEWGWMRCNKDGKFTYNSGTIIMSQCNECLPWLFRRFGIWIWAFFFPI